MNSQQFGGFLLLLSLLALVLAACGGRASVPPPPSGSVTIRVTLSESAISSAQTAFSPGIPYYFVVTNQGKETQEWMIVPIGMATNDMHTNALVMIDSISPGETKAVAYTFPLFAAGQPFEFVGSFHQQDKVAMHLSITVSGMPAGGGGVPSNR